MKPLTILVLLLVSLASVRAADRLSDSLQKGLLEEEANQNLDAAIQAYQAVLKQFDAERKIAATATYRLGECYRKQGKTNESLAEFQRVVREFADQTAFVTPSRKYLAQFGQLLTPAGNVPANAMAANPPISAEQVKLWREELDLAQQQLAEVEKKHQNAAADSADVIRAKRQLIPIERKLPENAPAERQQALIKEDIDLVRELASQARIRVEVGQATLADLIPLNRELLSLQRDLLAAQEAPAQARFQTRLNQIVRRAEPGEGPTEDETKEIDRIQRMTQDSPDLINAAREGETLLKQAAAKGQLAVARFLLDHGADVNAQSGSGTTALHAAAAAGHKAMVELLLARGAAVNARDNSQATPLHEAARNGYVAVAEVLIARSAEVNAVTANNKETPLLMAMPRRFQSMAELLLKNGANINAQDAAGRTPLMFVAQAMRPSEDSPYATTGQPSPRIALLGVLLTNKADVNLRRNDGQSPLSIAVLQGSSAVAELLLDHGANPNVQVSFDVPGAIGGAQLIQQASGTPLTHAAMTDQRAVAEALLKHGADVNAKDNSGRTSLHRAVIHLDVGMTQLLLANKADPNTEDNQGHTPLGFALRGAEQLGQGGPIGYGIENGVGYGARFGQYPMPGENRAMAIPAENPAVTEAKRAIVRAILDHGGDVNLANKDGTTPLDQAVFAGDTNVVNLVLAKGADVNQKDRAGVTALHVAVANGNTNMIELLVSKGADVDTQDETGNTPLHYAAINGHLAVAQSLLAHGARIEITDRLGLTPAEVVGPAQREGSGVLGVPIIDRVGRRSFPVGGNLPPSPGSSGSIIPTADQAEVRDFLRQQRLNQKAESRSTSQK